MKPFWVYMLRCRDGSFYVGHTDDLEKRVAEHQAGAIPGHTKSRRPVTLVYATDTVTRDEALQREMQIKGWTRAKKEALIGADWSSIRQLARGPDRLRPSTTGRSRMPSRARAALRSGRTGG
jgi:predicted GIY-YIG superfamily endonuclease